MQVLDFLIECFNRRSDHRRFLPLKVHMDKIDPCVIPEQLIQRNQGNLDAAPPCPEHCDEAPFIGRSDDLGDYFIVLDQ